jgi:pyrroline-5-carboxylate reductase
MRRALRSGHRFVCRVTRRGISDVSVGREAPPACQRLAVIGTGIMAEAIVNGVLDSGFLSPANIVTFDVNPKRTQYFIDKFDTEAASSLAEAVANADMVLLAVKPQNMPSVCNELRPVVPESATLVTMAAGVPMENLNFAKSVVRIMPNTPATIKQGITVWCTSEGVPEDVKKAVAELLSCIGTGKLTTSEFDISFSIN